MWDTHHLTLHLMREKQVILTGDSWFFYFFNQIFNKLHFLFLFTFKTIDALNHVQILNIEVGESLAVYSMQTS